jgi:hypothetical protein
MTRINIDGNQRGAGTQLALCAECKPWRELRGTRPAALLAAAEHAANVHGDYREADKLRTRAADTPSAIE